MTAAAKDLGDQPVFPSVDNIGPNGEICRAGACLTKRELFAAIMAAGYCGNPGLNNSDSATINGYALQQTDALLEQLAKQS